MKIVMAADNTKHLLAVVRASVHWANFSAGEGICAQEETGVVSPEDFLMAYSEATGDEDWETAPDRIADTIEAEIDSLQDACNHLSMLVVELSNQLSDQAGGYQVEWRPIETAPRDGEMIWVYCPSAHGLSEMVSLCCWHKDAGFCVDELRHPTLWFPILQPDHPSPTPSEIGWRQRQGGSE